VRAVGLTLAAALIGASAILACRSPARDTAERGGEASFVLAETTLVIPQIDYEPAIYYRDGDPYPHIDFSKLDRNRVVEKEQVAVVLENAYVRLTLLPEMGRVYALYYKPTGHDELWRNDIVTVGGGVNDTGWWIWIGGVEYTLPGDEHGTTWSTPWSWEVLEDAPVRKTVRMAVEELGTRLQETIDISLYPRRAYYEAAIRIDNPTTDTVHFAHWVNPQWTPGGHNELTDSTEFIIPTERVLIAEKWQPNMGPSPQAWAGNRYRFIGGWSKMGDLMADGVKEGFYSAYSHDEEEGIVRVFDKDKTPGVDIWTYGYHTTRIPMGSGRPNKGYVEMWGGTSELFPDERRPLPPGASLEWTEWMYPYHGTKGLTYADRELAVNLGLDPEGKNVIVGICPSGIWQGPVELWSGDQLLRSWSVSIDPEDPFLETIDVSQLRDEAIAALLIRIGSPYAGWRVLEIELPGPY